MRPAPQGAFRLRGKKEVFLKRSGWGSNPRPRASEEEAPQEEEHTPLRLTWQLSASYDLLFNTPENQTVSP